MKKVMIVVVLAIMSIACGEAAEDVAKEEVAMPDSLTDGKGDFRTDFYTDFRGQLSFGKAVQDRYTASFPNYYAGYTFELEAGDVFELRAGAVSRGFDSVIALYGPQRPNGNWGNIIAFNDDSPEGGTLDSLIRAEVRRGGTYLVLVREYAWRSGEFYVSLDCLDGSCKNSCSQVMCTLYCENGFKQDENGCDICACNDPEPVCEAADPGDAICIQVIAYATNPQTGDCCVYPTPCHVPAGYIISYDPSECGAPAPGPEPEPTPPGYCQNDTDCVVTGCSSHVCATEEMFTTCEWMPHYACYAPEYTSCGCVNNRCGWSQTEEFETCMESAGQL